MTKNYYQLYASSYEGQFYVDTHIYPKISWMQSQEAKEKFKKFLTEEYNIEEWDIKKVGYYTLKADE